MAQNTNIEVPAETWTLLTNSNVTSITFQNIGTHIMWVAGTVGASAPSSTDGSIVYGPSQGERNASLSDLFPGVSGANRVYAYSGRRVEVVVSHA